MKFITIALTFLSWAITQSAAGMLSPTDTITWGGDTSRSGYETTHNMDPAVVGSAQFGQLWKANLPGNYGGYLEQIYSQPLVYTLNDGIQYVFVATTQNNVYKINAKTGAIIASRSLHIPFLTSDLNGCVDINPTVGVTATGVIDPDTDTWYLTAKTYLDQTDKIKGLANGRYWFHAIDVNTLAEKSGFPKGIEGTIARNQHNRMFQSGIGHQRPALLHTGQYIYAGFASHCVQWNFTGWIMGWDKDTGAMVERYTMEGGPEPNTVPGAGVWMSGGGLATDGKGSMYFATGNGYSSQLAGTPVPGRQPPTSLEEAAVNMKLNDDGSISVVDFFMPWEKVQLDGADKDLGTTPLELLQPSVFTCPNVKRMGVVTGKSGKTYILNLDNLGGYQEGANKLDAVPQVFQNENSVYAGAGVYPGDGGYIYINVIQYATHVFKFSCDSNGNPQFTKVADTAEKNAYVLGTGHGATTSLNGQSGTGLYWVTDVDGYNLRIYNAVPQNGVLQLIKSANIQGVTKFSRPVFGDSRAYIGTNQGALYCFGSPVNLPFTCSSPNDFGKELLNSTSAPKTIQCQAGIDTQVTSLALKGNPNFQILSYPTLPASVSKGQNFSFQAVFQPQTPGPLSSDVVLTTVNNVAGYSVSTPVSLRGTGDSLSPLLGVSPNIVSFSGVITGQEAGGVTQSIIFTNAGDGALHISEIDFSIVSETGPFVTPNNTAQGPQVGPFTFQGLPTTIAGNSQATVNINFNPSTSGNYAVYVLVKSDGGQKVFDVVGTSGTYPKAVLEFQAADGSGTWIPYTNNSPPFTFGNVYEQYTRSLKMRLTNNGSSSAAALSVTVSKPPFGVPGIIGAQNQVDLAEGTVLAAGESATAVLYCSVPKSQNNVDSYSDTAQWTMNTGDPSFGKQFIQFTCNAVTAQVGPLYPNGSAIYRYDGCWKENDPGRQLKVQLWGQNANNNNGDCINACAAKGYALAGTEYESECWCGSAMPKHETNATDCNYLCSGNSSETCGGNGYFHDGSYISLFNNGGAVSSTGTTDPGIVQSVGGYNYSGCYTEATAGRALSAKAIATSDMTIEHCAANCTGYQLFGVEYGQECYCGNSLAAGSVKAADSDCSMSCAGKTSENCGNGGRLSLYSFGGKPPSAPAASSTAKLSGAKSSTAPPSSKSTGPVSVQLAGSFGYKGCLTEGTSGRALAAASTTSNSMTVAKCAAFCSSYRYMGVEYSSECYCANSLAAGAVLTTSGCSMTCSGDTKSLCGGPNRLSFYQNGAASSLSTTSTTSTSTTTTKATTGPTSVQKAGTYAYQGCYSEGTNSRALSDKQTALSNMTVEECASFCQGYTYMGTEYSDECYCGNNINTGSAPASSGCNMDCSGDSTELCGGPNRLSFYKVKPAGPSIVQTAGPFSYQGCYTEATNTRALSAKSTAGSTMTVEQCSTFCTGYSMMGVEYSGECYCGNTLNTGSVLATSGCSMTCSGDATEYCGGPNRLNLYSTGNSAKTSSTSTTTSTKAPAKTSTKAPVAATPTIVLGNANFTYSACYTDSPGARSLPNEVIANDQMTVESCLQACSAYTYAGLEYARECWCGNTLASTAVQATADSQCNMKCLGDSSELCGAGNRLTLYTHVQAVKPQAKFAFAHAFKVAPSSSVATNGTTSGTLTGPSSSVATNGTTSGIPTGASSNSSITSVSGGTTPAISSPTKVASTTNSTDGHTSTKPPTFISSVKPKSTTTSHNTSSTAPTLVPTPSQTVGSYSYLGCANQTNPLALVGMSKKDAKGMTNEACQTFCLKNNYGLAATQDGDTCYCGNGLQSYSSLDHQTCKTPCAGNSSEICGGHDTQGSKYLSVWNSTSTSVPATTVKQVGYYVSQGCYSSPKNTPILNGTSYTDPAGTSIESCVGYCITKGFDVAAVQGTKCSCDSTLAKTAKKEAIGACNDPCVGNSREFCGASAKWNVYQKNLTSVDSDGAPLSINLPNLASIHANNTGSAL